MKWQGWSSHLEVNMPPSIVSPARAEAEADACTATYSSVSRSRSRSRRKSRSRNRRRSRRSRSTWLLAANMHLSAHPSGSYKTHTMSAINSGEGEGLAVMVSPAIT